jgi:hypothetical protein
MIRFRQREGRAEGDPVAGPATAEGEMLLRRARQREAR